MNEHAQIVHHTANGHGGRVRIQIPGRRSDRNFFANLTEQLRGVERVLAVRSNPAAASIVLEYAGELGTLVQDLADASITLSAQEMEEQMAADAQQIDVLQRFAGGVSKELTRLGAGDGARVNPMLLVCAAFGAMGLVQTARGDIMIPALSAFWYAVGAWRLAQSPGGAGPPGAQT